ncbi:1,6-anhydro-N-acetylmuramyl-L-alanine amidase AmpD [Comamonas kerstersii]|jgi:AmpD protein|uniref:1,6-anhydro-N-acetylmuramyl-L-alanine amidase AmpD n=1 Tax=Comamonas kerstersii TaxID=225992 RepID=A0A1V3TLR9_9BURK|nr:1,6-anhydro-N-acetylmuramyl-L-alanine amidase AmpD [Comamonas kerstersii]AQZ98301.1 N-acetylmuramoyl-L-alanine amidase [Comamonas kerstersii]MDO4970438.1 1,6-anhydro-N-acetylmuramyl-L-alanine amidase AmpD [Comamonadaceae bacterium]OOH86806.1 N-acetylmuramoyl-L-alanine amidase [Comamonas kerstersii]OOH90182.1 N-acetylmuramoyl-L-alanine amidase [Comamonas kerstersii]
MTHSTDFSAATWHQGWLSCARQQPSPNFGPRPADTPITLAVVHSISLPPGQYGTGCVQQLFANQLNWDAHPYFQGIRGLEVSSHFFITREGELWQFVSCDDRAWHAGKSQWCGRENCNDYSIGIELEGLEGLHFEAPQYQTLSQLCMQLAAHYPLTHIAGHEHIAPGRKQDPGAGFAWELLHAQLQHLPLQFP